MCIFTQPLLCHDQDVTQGQFLSELCIYQPLNTGRMWHKVSFKVEFNKFEFSVFILLDLLPNYLRR